MDTTKVGHLLFPGKCVLILFPGICGMGVMAEAAPNVPDAIEQAVDEAIAICDGDVCAALRAALLANTFLADEVERLTKAVSAGYTRRRSPARRAGEKLDQWRETAAGRDEP